MAGCVTCLPVGYLLREACGCISAVGGWIALLVLPGVSHDTNAVSGARGRDHICSDAGTVLAWPGDQFVRESPLRSLRLQRSCGQVTPVPLRQGLRTNTEPVTV
jgi:hypothetical protein